jgi:hypothetical protein
MADHRAPTRLSTALELEIGLYNSLPDTGKWHRLDPSQWVADSRVHSPVLSKLVEQEEWSRRSRAGGMEFTSCSLRIDLSQVSSVIYFQDCLEQFVVHLSLLLETSTYPAQERYETECNDLYASLHTHHCTLIIVLSLLYTHHCTLITVHSLLYSQLLYTDHCSLLPLLVTVLMLSALTLWCLLRLLLLLRRRKVFHLFSWRSEILTSNTLRGRARKK